MLHISLSLSQRVTSLWETKIKMNHFWSSCISFWSAFPIASEETDKEVGGFPCDEQIRYAFDGPLCLEKGLARDLYPGIISSFPLPSLSLLLQQWPSIVPRWAPPMTDCLAQLVQGCWRARGQLACGEWYAAYGPWQDWYHPHLRAPAPSQGPSFTDPWPRHKQGPTSHLSMLKVSPRFPVQLLLRSCWAEYLEWQRKWVFPPVWQPVQGCTSVQNLLLQSGGNPWEPGQH